VASLATLIQSQFITSYLFLVHPFSGRFTISTNQNLPSLFSMRVAFRGGIKETALAELSTLVTDVRSVGPLLVK